MTAKLLEIDDALNILSASESADVDRLKATILRDAGVTLMYEVNRLRRELEWAAARARSMRPSSEHEGYPLIEGASHGGPRHYLGGRPVSAGTGLYLLTDNGWLPGRYEWNFEAGTPGRFYVGLPGLERSAVCSIPVGARLAWKDEI